MFATVIMDLASDGPAPYIIGGMMKGSFKAESVHFHWGSIYSKGSEHAINNNRYDGEMHILHKNSKYSNLSVDAASKYPDGLAALAVFLKAVPSLELQKWQETKQEGLNRILNALPKLIPYKSKTTIIGRFSVKQVLSIFMTGEFYTYKGA